MVIFFIILFCLLVFGAMFLYVANKLYKHTNTFRNRYTFIKQFEPLTGRPNSAEIIYDVVNIGSNPARFAFFYENINGSNWSTGIQGFDMDLEILKAFSSHLHKGSYVLLPIVTFSSVSGYLKGKSPAYLSKFAFAFKGLPKENEPEYVAAKKWAEKAFFHHPKAAIRALLFDTEKDQRLERTEMSLMQPELIEDAKRWMKCWKDEFNIQDFEEPLSGALLEGRKKSVEMFRELLDYCISQGFKPVIISPPLSVELGNLFTPNIKKIYVDSFIQEFKEYNVPYLDYIYDTRFTSNELFFNALFMNLNGRKKFTHQVLKDLNII